MLRLWRMLRFWRVKSVTFSIIRRILGYVSNRNIFCNSPQSSNRNRRRMGATQKRSPFFLTSMCKKKRTSTRERGGLNELEAVMSVHTGTVSSSLNCAIMQACLACSLLSEFRPQLNPKISGGHSMRERFRGWRREVSLVRRVFHASSKLFSSQLCIQVSFVCSSPLWVTRRSG